MPGAGIKHGNSIDLSKINTDAEYCAVLVLTLEEFAMDYGTL